MSVFDLLAGMNPAATGSEALIDHAIKTGFRYRFLDELGNRASDSLFPNDSQKMNHEQAALDIMLKKRALGLPVSTAEYEQIDNKKTAPSRVLSIFKREAIRGVPTPDSMKPYHVPFAAHAAGDTIKAFTKRVMPVAKGEAYAHPIGDVLRLFAGHA